MLDKTWIDVHGQNQRGVEWSWWVHSPASSTLGESNWGASVWCLMRPSARLSPSGWEWPYVYQHTVDFLSFLASFLHSFSVFPGIAFQINPCTQILPSEFTFGGTQNKIMGSFIIILTLGLMCLPMFRALNLSWPTYKILHEWKYSFTDNFKKVTKHAIKRKEAKWASRECTMRKDFHNCLKENVFKGKANYLSWQCQQGRKSREKTEWLCLLVSMYSGLVFRSYIEV